MWIAPEVKDPVLTHAPTRKSIACFGAVSLETGKFAYNMCETFDAKTFEAFLMLLLRRRTRDKRMVVVLDNARYHHAKLLAPLLRKYRKVPAAIQPAIGANRTSLETHPKIGHTQPVLRDSWRGTRCRTAMLLQVAKAQLCIEATMRHYLRRYV